MKFVSILSGGKCIASKNLTNLCFETMINKGFPYTNDEDEFKRSKLCIKKVNNKFVLKYRNEREIRTNPIFVETIEELKDKATEDNSLRAIESSNANLSELRNYCDSLLNIKENII